MLCAVQDKVLQQPQARVSWREQVDQSQEEQQVSLLYNDVMQQEIEDAVVAVEEADPPEPPEQLTPPPKKKRQGFGPTDLVPSSRDSPYLAGLVWAWVFQVCRSSCTADPPEQSYLK